MNNNEFLKELNFFKNNPKKAEKFDRDITLSLTFVLIVGFFYLIPFVDTNVLVTYFISGTISIVALSLYAEYKNFRIEQFENVIYTGDLKDLFGDLESPDIKDCLDDIAKEMKNYLGIRGAEAIHISDRINSPYLREQRLKQDKVNKQIEEILTLQRNG